MSAILTFRLPAPLQLPNRKGLARNRFAAAGKVATARKALAWEVSIALAGSRPVTPFKFCTIQIYRHGIQAPDIDNLYASAKDLLDVLQPSTKRRTFGLGIIADDKPSRCLPTVRHVQAKKRDDQCTVVVIRELSAVEFEAVTSLDAAA